jgi:Zn-dependent protease with chaperone function
MAVAASYFNGLSAHRHSVVLDVRNGMLQLHGEDIGRGLKPGQYTIPNRLGNSPRLILLADGGRCEIPDTVGFDRLLGQLGYQPSLVAHIELRWHFMLAIALSTVALLAAAYFFGLPYAAEKIAYQVPAKMLVLIDGQFVKTLDDRLMQPSKLAPAHQQSIENRLRSLSLPPSAIRPGKLLFRNSPGLGANALTLPGNTIVVLDGLVALSTNDEDIIAVLAHELGHIAGRHPLRQTLQASAVGLVMGWLVGDFSGILAIAPATLLESRYSREFERQADNFAADILQRNNIPAQRLADMLKKLEKAQGSPASDHANPLLGYFSSHPATSERERVLGGGE